MLCAGKVHDGYGSFVVTKQRHFQAVTGPTFLIVVTLLAWLSPPLMTESQELR